MSMAQILKLKPAFSDEQAQALAGLFDDDVATKADLEKIRSALAAEVEKLRIDVRADIEKLRLEVQRDLTGVQRDLKALENRILSRMMTLFIGQGLAIVSLVVALQRLLG